MAHTGEQLAHIDGTAIRIAVVEDEPLLSELLAMTMKAEGWEARTSANGEAGLRMIREFQPDAVILDVMLPGIDGVEVVKRLRAAGDDVPVLFLTAKDDLSDRLLGLSSGGDDYVTKPFSLEEVVIRLRGMVRRYVRTSAETGTATLTVGDLVLNTDTYEATRAGHPIELTATEFSLLRYLMENPRIVLSKAQILDTVWNYDFGGKASVVEIYISYLRKKIDVLGPPMIHTLRGVGYSLKAAEETTDHA